jgi:polyisoprenoid-binding protein YceI
VTRGLKILIAAVVVIIALGGVGVWWYLRDDSPDEVSLETAVESVEAADRASTTSAAAGSGSSTTTGAASAAASAIAGTWTVDAETGDFDYESATGTFVGFRVKEELSSIGSTEAVGRTGDVTGSITIDGTTLTSVSIEADLTTITTNESRRDDRVQQALETSQFPTATFRLAGPVDLGAAATQGGPVSVAAPGDLTIHGVTNRVEMPIQAQLVNDTVVVVGSLDISFPDYGVEVPSAPVVVSAEDHGPLELQLLLKRS